MKKSLQLKKGDIKSLELRKKSYLKENLIPRVANNENTRPQTVLIIVITMSFTLLVTTSDDNEYSQNSLSS